MTKAQIKNELFEAFLGGFNCSNEEFNGKYTALNPKELAKRLKDRFEEWEKQRIKNAR